MADKKITDHIEEIEDTKQDWVQQFDKLGEEALADQLKEMEMEDVADQETFQQLINIASDAKAESYLNTMRDNVREILGLNQQTFNVEKYEDLPKVDIAQKIADYVVNTENIRPVYMGKEEKDIQLFKYDRNEGIWRGYSTAKLHRTVRRLAKSNFTQHLKRETKEQVLFHPNFKRMRNMGTSEKWVLINDCKKINISDLSDIKNLQEEQVKKTDYALHKVNVNYRPEAECPEFKEFTNKLLDGKEKQVKTLQEFMGWLLKYPNRDYKKMLLILGVSNSGKSQLADLIEALFKNKSGKSVLNLSFPMMGADRTFHLNRLETALLNIDKDLSGREIRRADLIKKIAAQESLEVEPKGEDSFNINPDAKHVVCSNVAPKIDTEDDSAFLNRFLTLKAPNPVPREERVTDLGKKLFEKEADGIFNWMLKGLQRLEENERFTIMPKAPETRKMWMEFGDSVHRFLWQMCDTHADVNEEVIEKDELYDIYVDWYEQNPTMSDKEIRNVFKKKIKDLPTVKDRRVNLDGRRVQAFCGIKCDTSEIYGLEPEDLKDERPDDEREVV